MSSLGLYIKNKTILCNAAVAVAACIFGFIGNANAAVTIKSATGMGVSSGTPSSARVVVPIRASAPIRIGTTTLPSNRVSTTRAGTYNTIGKFLGGSVNQLKPGASIKIPTTGGGGTTNIDLSNYVTQQQYDYLENVVNNLEPQVDLSNYYDIPETDTLLDEKLFRDDLVAGDNITISEDLTGKKIISSSGLGAKGDTGVQGPIGPAGEQGPAGPAGADGRDIIIRNDGTYLQWQYDGDVVWTNLVALSSLQGADGINGLDGIDGADGADGAAGTNGREVEMRFDSVSGYVQWRLVGDELWLNLIDVATLTNVDISGKADKVTGAAGGNLAGLTNTEGNLTDSGIAADKVITIPDSSELTQGDGGYVITVDKSGTGVGGPTYMKVY